MDCDNSAPIWSGITIASTIQPAASRWGNTLMAQVFNAWRQSPAAWRQGTSGRDTPSFPKVSTTQQLLVLLGTRVVLQSPRSASVASFRLVPAVRTPQRPPLAEFRSPCPI